jgi:hypothetical protein
VCVCGERECSSIALALHVSHLVVVTHIHVLPPHEPFFVGIKTCNSHLSNPHQHVLDYFSPLPITAVGRGEIRGLIAESLFNTLQSELSSPTDLAELDAYVTLLETDMEVCFPPCTQGPLPPLMRLHHDPVLAYAKPLLYYACVAGGDMCSDLVLYCLGFRRRQAGVLSYWILHSPGAVHSVTHSGWVHICTDTPKRLDWRCWRGATTESGMSALTA